MKYTHLLFDLDNTLLNFSTASLEALKGVCQSLRLEYNQDFLDVYHNINHDLWYQFEKGLIDTITLRKRRFEDTAKYFGIQSDGLFLNRTYVQGIIRHGQFMPGAREMLDLVRQKHSIHIITNGLKEAQRPRLKEANIYHLFDSITVSDEIGHAKPHFNYFDYVWKNMASPTKEKVLVIGDSLQSDILGGNRFGFHTCLYDPNKKHTDHKANYHISHLNDLLGILEE